MQCGKLFLHNAKTLSALAQAAPGQMALDLNYLAAILPDFDAPSRFDFDQAHGAALDAFFETLSQDERDEKTPAFSRACCRFCATIRARAAPKPKGRAGDAEKLWRAIPTPKPRLGEA